VRSYGQYCPIAKAAQMLGDRWTVLIVREMSFGVDQFNEMERCLPGISRSVLTQRLRYLEHLGLIERQAASRGRAVKYTLTDSGGDLKPVLKSLGEWAARWAFRDPDPSELDPDLLMRWMSRHIAVDQLPDRRIVAQFVFAVPKNRRYWLVLEREEASVCLHEPGFDTDVIVTADTEALYSVYMGRRTLNSAIRDELVRVDGAPSLVRAFPRWFAWSDFAPTVRFAANTR
jgi:DNA-binding HxlR family transcriptional regulator